MNNLKTIIFFVIAAIVLESCKELQLTTLHPDSVIPKAIPSLRLIENNETAATNITPAGYNPAYLYSTYQDAQVLYHRFIEDSVVLPDTTHGYAEFHTIMGENHYKGWGWYLLSIGTLGVGNLCGMPFLNATTSLEVEVDIYTNDKKLIAKYIGQGSAKVPVALYYGYSMQSALRVANISSVKMALHSIRQQIQANAVVIAGRLKS